MFNRLERRIEINQWLIKSRWFYGAGIVFIGLVRKMTSTYDLPNKTIVWAWVITMLVNLLNLLILKIGKKLKSEALIFLLGFWQIAFELAIFTLIFYLAGGIESLVALSFFMPIIATGFFYGTRGSVISAIISGVLIFTVVTLEFTGKLNHIFVFGVPTYHYSSYLVALSYVASFTIYFIIIGAYSGHISSLLIRRELLLDDNAEKLEQESKYRKNEWSQLDKTAKLLVKRDKELLFANSEMDKKVKELQHSEAAMMKAFSDLKEGKIALEAEKNRTSAIIENIIDPIIVINNDSKIELLNQSARSVFRFSDEYNNSVIDPKDNYSMNNFKPIIDNDYQVSMSKEEQGVDSHEELVLETSGQETTYKVVTAKVIDVKNEDLGVMKIFYNLTREKMLDKLKSEFITIAAHQLRTPLSAIKWVIKMVLDGDAGPLSEEQTQLLNKGYKSNERIITLVNDMLNVSRIEEGRFGYKMQKEDLVKALDNILEALSGIVNNKGIKLTVSKEADFPLLNIDVKKISLVLQNLIENAIKYTPEHGRINIKMRKDEQYVQVVIEDNGIGIPAADKQKLFTKFYRAENALRLQTEGSGLGLFIVRNIVKEHGGDISFESEEGVGTTFVITLPLEFIPVEEVQGKSEV